MKATLGWSGVMILVAGVLYAQKPTTLPQQWFTQKSTEGTFATSAGAWSSASFDRAASTIHGCSG